MADTDLLFRLARARALRDAATPGPWSIVGGHNDFWIMHPDGGSDHGWPTGPKVMDIDTWTPCPSGADARLIEAAPDLVTLAEDLAATLERAEEERDRLAAELAEARRVLAAERGVGGAPSDAWRYQQHHRNDMGAWHRGGATVKKWGRGSASWLLTMGTAGTGHETAREAMQAADAALRGNGDDEIHAAAAAVDGRTGEPL